MTCADCRRELTAYLDGELEGDRGGALRGHLRACAACRATSDDESALRDGLRMLPPLDPPPSMWAGVQAQLAAAEAADAETPAWRRRLARWLPSAPRFALAAVACAAVIALAWSRLSRAPAEDVAIAPPPPSVIVRTVGAPQPVVDAMVDLAAEPARIVAQYRQTADELVAQAGEIQKEWTDAQRAAFASKIAALRSDAEAAAPGKAQRRAWAGVVRYLEGALIRDDVALAGGLP